MIIQKHNISPSTQMKRIVEYRFYFIEVKVTLYVATNIKYLKYYWFNCVVSGKFPHLLLMSLKYG